MFTGWNKEEHEGNVEVDEEKGGGLKDQEKRGDKAGKWREKEEVGCWEGNTKGRGEPIAASSLLRRASHHRLMGNHTVESLTLNKEE